MNQTETMTGYKVPDHSWVTFDVLPCEACTSSAGALRMVHQCKVSWCGETHVAVLCIDCKHFVVGASHEQPAGVRSALQQAALEALQEAGAA